MNMCEDCGMNQQAIARAFNEWMRRYIEEPEAYQAEFNTVAAFRAAEADGVEPDYGQQQAAYLQHLLDEVAA